MLQGPRKAGRVTQVPTSDDVTLVSSQSNFSSSLDPGPVYGTSSVSSPLVPSPPRSQTSDDVPAKPEDQNKICRTGDSSSARRRSTWTSFFVRLFSWLMDSRIAPTDGPEAPSGSKTHAPPAPSPYYVYTNPARNSPSTSTSGTSLRKVQRVNSYNSPSMVLSPLRYPIYDSRHSHEDGRPSPNRAANHKPPPEMHGPYHACP
jgi:hypothetical protein